MPSTLGRVAQDIEIEYSRHPRLVLIIILGLVVLTVPFQSFIAQPRPAMSLLADTWEFVLIVLLIMTVIVVPRVRYMFAIGLGLMIASLLRAFFLFPAIVEPEYATLAASVGLWLLVDSYAESRSHRSLLRELLRGNARIAGAVLLATIGLGALVELINAPVQLWWYRWPFPSLTLLELPIFLVLFGWFPWVLGILSVFYGIVGVAPSRPEVPRTSRRGTHRLVHVKRAPRTRRATH